MTKVSVRPVRNSVQSCFIISWGHTTVGVLLPVAEGHRVVVNGLNFQEKRAKCSWVCINCVASGVLEL